MKKFTPSIHLPFPLQGLLRPTPRQSSMSTSQSLPVYPGLQSQLKSFIKSTHCPLLLQVTLMAAHSSMFISQIAPVHPGVQMHVKMSSPSKHCPLLLQSTPTQLSISWQNSPVNPGSQVQLSLQNRVQSWP